MASRTRFSSPFAATRRHLAALAASGILAFLGFGMVSSSGCLLSTGGIDNGQGGGGTSTTTGTGGAPECTMATNDPKCSDGNPCTKDVCEKGVCKNPPDNDAPSTDTNPCTEDTCKDGVAVHTNLPAGTECGTALKCDDSGICRCTTDIQCGVSTTCLKKTCDMAKGCVETPQTDLKLPDPVPNDCKGVKCDNTGKEVAYNENMDKPVDDGVVCTDDLCTNGVGSHPLSAEGTACMGQNVCDPVGACVFCTENFGCDPAKGEYCFANGSACPSCSDLVKDGDESDVNCGGTHCPTMCADGKTCNSAADCINGNCNSGTCISCMDGAPNGTESDVDCGGTCLTKCANGKTCNGNGDCMSGSCFSSKCVSCDDGVKNGTESDIDCGGACATKCAVGNTCGNNNDCSNGKCADNYCCNATCAGACKSCGLPGKKGACTNLPLGVDDPSCNNGDLCDGSGSCQVTSGMATKAIGEACADNTKCFNGNCVAGYCKLQTNDYCTEDWVCGSYHCAANICLTCASSADCPNMNNCSGGVCKLSNEELCKENSDCQSNKCMAGKCKP